MKETQSSGYKAIANTRRSAPPRKRYFPLSVLVEDIESFELEEEAEEDDGENEFWSKLSR
ncbi:unknown protein [Simkania negevensis Z]|uniref:Uncharacterized protein n=1 Tax=Simkania negevensis (strain ATCC VR-1471 / DSM 27360 / Z) TaxID=331113 RepID=F8L5N1_SIMNZ|nr:unknown protein [Simkania negevensis Z]